MSWQPNAPQANRVARADLYREIREFFQARNFIEVDPPLLGRAAATDPHLHSLATTVNDSPHYLQTSPEFFMKRLLAAGSGPIYSIGKSFRAAEQGRYHNVEFTLLEWYQPGFDDQALMTQVGELLQKILGLDTERRSYRDVFLEFTGLNPHTADRQTLADFSRDQLQATWDDTDKDTYLEAIFSHYIQPQLENAVCIYDYPANQAALARLGSNDEGEQVAKRFEVFAQGVELGNGYWELCDAKEQQRRFIADQQRRQTLNLAPMPHDEKLIAAMVAGLPDCAGIAMGLDRLLMLKTGAKHIDEVLDFPAHLV